MTRRWIALALLVLLVGCQKRGAAAAREAKERAEEKEAAEQAEQANVAKTAPADGRLRGCTIEGVQKTVRSEVEGIKRCYRKALAKNPSAAGKLAVEIQIDRTGRAKFLGVQTDEIGDEDFTRCVFAVLKPLPFPIPDNEPCIVVYPFALSAGPRK